MDVMSHTQDIVSKSTSGNVLSKSLLRSLARDCSKSQGEISINRYHTFLRGKYRSGCFSIWGKNLVSL